MFVRSDDLEKTFLCQGRRYVRDGRLFLNHSGASLKGVLSGTTLRLTIASEAVSPDRKAYVRLTLDGKTRRLALEPGEHLLTRSFSRGKHVFEIVKLTESANNTFEVISVGTDGTFLPCHDEPERRIEFIGDSVTTGYGVLAPASDGDYKTSEQDVTRAFPGLVSHELNAAYQVIAAGGWPIWRSKYSDYAIPDYYDNVDFLRNTDKWDDSLFRADYRIVALGANDYFYLDTLSESERPAAREEVKRRLLAFVRRLLEKEGKVILMYGFFPYPDLGALTEEVAAEIDSPRVSTLAVRSAVSLGNVRAGHPGGMTHRLAAARLVRRIYAMERP